MIRVLWSITLGLSGALQAPPGRKTLRTTSGLGTLATTRRSDQPPPLAAAAVRKAAARLAFTGLVATAASFAPAAAAKGGGGGAGASSYSSTSYSSSSYDRSYWESDLYYDSKVAVPPLLVCGFLGLSIGIDILVDPDSKPIPDGWKTRIRNAKLDEWEANREIYTSKLAATNRLMATLQDDFAAARSGAGDRLRTGRYVGRTTEDDGGDQSIVANLCFQADGRVTGNGRDGLDGAYTLDGRYFEGRCAWVESYRDGLKVAVTGAVPRWPGSRLELSFVSNRGITGSASLRRVAETSGRAAAMNGAAAPVLAVVLAAAAVCAPHPAYARGSAAARYYCRSHPYSDDQYCQARGSIYVPYFESAPKCAVLYQANGGPFYGPGVLSPSSFPAGRFATVTYPGKNLDGTSRPLVDWWSRNIILDDEAAAKRLKDYNKLDGELLQDALREEGVLNTEGPTPVLIQRLIAARRAVAASRGDSGAGFTRVDDAGRRIYPEWVVDSDSKDDDYYMVGSVRLWPRPVRLYESARCVYYLGDDGAPAFAVPNGGDVAFYGSQVLLLAFQAWLWAGRQEMRRYADVKALMQTLATSEPRGRAPADGRYAGGRLDLFGRWPLRKTVALDLPPSATVADAKQKLQDKGISLDKDYDLTFGGERVKEGRPLADYGGSLSEFDVSEGAVEVRAATEWDLTFAANGTMYGTGVDAPGTLEGRWAGDRCAWIETYDYEMDRRRLDKNLEASVPDKARAPDFEVVVTGKLVGDGIDVDFYSNKGRKGSARLTRSASPGRAAMTDVLGLVAAALRRAEPSLARTAA